MGFLDYRILFGSSNNIVAIWADPDASYTNGKFYAATADSFNIVNINTSSLYDRYTNVISGRVKETLDSNDVSDINIGV